MGQAIKEWKAVGCCKSCYFAKHEKCKCRCKGAGHGLGRKIIQEKKEEASPGQPKLQDIQQIYKTLL